MGRGSGGTTSETHTARRWQHRRVPYRQYAYCLLPDEGCWSSTQGAAWQGQLSRSDWRSTTADTGSWLPRSPRSASSPLERHSPVHTVHIGRMPVQRRPAHTTRALLAVDGKGERQDRD